MARSQSLLSAEPTNVVQQQVTIGHVQLRDLVICPDERGIVNFVCGQSIVELDITKPSSMPINLVNLNYTPNTIASLQIPDSEERLLAAGGQDAELHLSIHSKRSKHSPRNDSSESSDRPVFSRTRRLWQYDSTLQASINNSVLLTSLSLTRSHESSAEPRVAVSNNDCTVKFFDVNVRGSRRVDGSPKRINEAGILRLEVPVNHSSISPDGRTLLSVGDSPHVYLHGLTGGARITFTKLTQLTLPPFDQFCAFPSSVSAVPASFSTAFSSCGTKFAVASQEGMVAVWDVRSRKPMKVYQTDRTRPHLGRNPTGAASGYLYDETWDWTRPGNRAPGWGVRNVKFSPARHGGRELMTFTEHTSLLHVIDATTFESEEIIRVPSLVSESTSSPGPSPLSHSTTPIPPTEPVPWPAQIPRLPPVPAPQPRIMFNGAGLPTIAPPSRVRRYLRPRRRGLHEDAEEDEASERTLRRVLRELRAPAVDDERDEDAEMDVDELESDCVTSRAGSPAPVHVPVPAPVPQPQPRAPGSHHFLASSPVPAVRAKQRLAVQPHLDLAGTCFDPRGQHIYVASTNGIVEWGVRGAEKRWLHEMSWA